jgi:hypothetical protein
VARSFGPLFTKDSGSIGYTLLPRAAGDPSEWRSHLSVRTKLGWGDAVMPEPYHTDMIEAALRELERSKTETEKAGVNALYFGAQICMQGDVQSSDGTSIDPMGHCTKCGSTCVHHCISCNEPIRGQNMTVQTSYIAPSFCHGCGKPYPWMDEKLKIARDLLLHDEKLSYEERKELWGLLQYVMSNPKAELAPAKSKLLLLKVPKATDSIREFVTDLLVKYAAEMSKP